MMIRGTSRPNPITAWGLQDDTRTTVSSPYYPVSFSGGDYPHFPSLFPDSFKSLQRYLPSNDFITESDSLSGDESWPDSPIDAFSSDQFRMYEFKVRRCTRGRSHDWTQCPFVHPGEKARRRDPRKYHYSGTACPEFRKGSCEKGDACEFAHGVFECWLHPARYRTQPCKDGSGCRRRTCFFAHTPEQLRILTGSSESELGGSVRQCFDSYVKKFATGSFVSSPTSILVSPSISPPSDSPPVSPSGSWTFGSASELVISMRKMQLGNDSWGMQASSRFGSSPCSGLPPGFCGTPTTPTQTPTRSSISQLDSWGGVCEEEPVMERVESGKELRAKMYAKLSKNNSLGGVDSTASAPNGAWDSELVK